MDYEGHFVVSIKNAIVWNGVHPALLLIMEDKDLTYPNISSLEFGH